MPGELDDAMARRRLVPRWIMALRRMTGKAVTSPTMWLGVIALAVVFEAPAECYFAIVAFATTVSGKVPARSKGDGSGSDT